MYPAMLSFRYEGDLSRYTEEEGIFHHKAWITGNTEGGYLTWDKKTKGYKTMSRVTNRHAEAGNGNPYTEHSTIHLNIT